MNLFYCTEISGHLATLDENESKHAVRVLRIRVGETVQFIDGKGGWYTGTVVSADPRSTVIAISEAQIQQEPLPYYLHLAVAPTKNIDRFEWILEKATELGIDRITPIICERSERKVVKTDRSFRVVLSAVKQSLKAWLPTLDEPMAFGQFIRSGLSGQKMIAHCEAGQKLPITSLLIGAQEYTIMIGPEGDFSAEEIDQAEKAGFSSISLGESRLRTETAAITACNAVYLNAIKINA